MSETIDIRYGRQYQVVLAIAIPCLLIVPFIFVMQFFKDMEAWKVWLTIAIFLVSIIGIGLWLAMSVYPAAKLRMDGDILYISFRNGRFLYRDFQFLVRDIASLQSREIGSDTFHVFETRNPSRKFQISAANSSTENTLDLDNLIANLREHLKKI